MGVQVTKTEAKKIFVKTDTWLYASGYLVSASIINFSPTQDTGGWGRERGRECLEF